jgi:superfamily II DNA or RNA helicase
VTAVQLRDYQAEAIHRVRQALKRVPRVLLQAPTGAGKTVLASFMVGQTTARNLAAWFICHRAELVEGTSKTFHKFGQSHGLIAAGHPMNLRQPAQVCSIQTLVNRLDALQAPRLAIVDECHHCSAEQWARVIRWLAERGTLIVGLSATPQRLDGQGLDAHFDELVLGPSVAWLMEHGHLSPYRVFAPPGPDMSGVRKQLGDYAKGETEARVDRPKLLGDMIDHWRRHANGLRTVAFGVTVAHSQHIAAQFNAAGVPAAHLDGGTPKGERARIIRDYAEGHLRVITNVDLFGEGFDLAAIAQRDVTVDCVIQGRPTQSLSLHLQQVGRALRPGNDKVAVILDHAGNTQRHGLPDDEREWTLEGRQKGKRADNDNGPPPPVICAGCFNAVRRPLPQRCPHCGKQFEAASGEIKVAEGELVEITEAQKRELRQARIREEAQAKTLDELIALGKQRGYKFPMQWAQKRFGFRAARRSNHAA